MREGKVGPVEPIMKEHLVKLLELEVERPEVCCEIGYSARKQSLISDYKGKFFESFMCELEALKGYHKTKQSRVADKPFWTRWGIVR